MSTELEQRITELAALQQGIVTRAQLLAVGMTPGRVRGRLEAGRLVAVHRGVYVLGNLVGSLEPALAREMAAVLACGPEAVLSHRSAGALWKLLPGPHRPEPIDVLLPRHVRRRRPGIRTRRTRNLLPHDITTRDGVPITRPARTLRDLASVLPSGELKRVVVRARRYDLIPESELSRLGSRHRSRPGAPLLRAIASDGSSLRLTRSEAEDRFLDLVRSSRLPAPEANVLLEGYEVDFLWRREKLVVEVDGFEYHSSRRRFEGDRRRDGDLTAAGFRVVRVTWRHLVDDRDATVARLAGALARSSR